MTTKIPSSAGGWGAILYSLKMARRAGGTLAILRALASKNTCKTCALGMGGQSGGLRNEKGHFPEVCNKSFQAQAADMQGAIPHDFFDRYDVPTLRTWSPQQLELSGRLTCPLLCENHRYRPVTWEKALNLLAIKLKATAPERTFFYASGRSSNEAGFLLQLFARIFGTNNVSNCSYYCHQASGVGLTQTLGTGTATIQLEDLDHADLLFLIGANPSSNHPRFMTLLMQIRRRGGKVIVVNPARERGLEKFSVPSDLRSLIFGSEIASSYIQPHIGGDIALLKGIAKALFRKSESNPEIISTSFIQSSTEHFEDYKRDIEQTPWSRLETESGLAQAVMEDLAGQYAQARNVIFAWSMGITHHSHGVENVQSIVNLALLRGMVGKKHAGLLPLRGHSNVQGIGSMGVTPQLQQAVMENLESLYRVSLPSGKGLDTLACMEAAHNHQIDFAWNLGGNLFASNPDSHFAEKALGNIDFVLYMSTTLNMGHLKGRGGTTLILPVLARDEEPQATTQESMFSYVRMSDGGRERYPGPRSEVNVISEVAERVLSMGPIPWNELRQTSNIRKTIGKVIPGFEKMEELDRTRKEFHVKGRTLHQPSFPTANGKARFTVCSQPAAPPAISKNNAFKLTTVRSEGQFNTVVYDNFDRYRGIKSRDVVLISPEDIRTMGWKENDRVTVKNATGQLQNQKIQSYPIKPGNIMMYYPEANILVPRIVDEQSRTPAFKSVDVTVVKG